MIKFKYIVISTAFLIAGCAAFFSVYGIGLLFSGAMVATILMASSLEIGKLVSTSWLYNYWSVTNGLMKSYLIMAILVLMGITSIGIFGYLTAAHQKSALETELAENKIRTLGEQKTNDLNNILVVNKTIDKFLELRRLQEERLAITLTNTTIARNPIQLQGIQEQIDGQITGLNKQIEIENEKIKQYNENISKLDTDIYTLKIESTNKKDISTFRFVAEEFNTDIRTVVKWFIIILITVFDPLAIVLLLAFNITLKNNSNSNNKTNLVEYEIYKESEHTNKNSESTQQSISESDETKKK